MKLSDVQNTLNEYLKGNAVWAMLMQFAPILTLIRPIYILMTRISFLHIVTGIIGWFSIFLYFAYFIGLILCFAKNDFKIITAAFALKTLTEVVDVFMFSFNINAILSIVIYGFLTFMAFNYYKSNYEI